MTKERTLFKNQISPEELEKKLRELDKFIQNKKSENNSDTQKLYEAAQNVVEILKNLSLSADKIKEASKDQEIDNDKEQNKQGFMRTHDVIEKTLSSLNKFMDEEKEKEKEEERKKEEENRKKQNPSQEHNNPEKNKQKELEEQERKKKLELEEEQQKKQKEEEKLKKSLEETRQVIEEILEHERKMRKEAYEKESSKELGKNVIQALESSLPPLNKSLGNVNSKQVSNTISNEKEQFEAVKGNDKFKEIAGQLKSIFGKLGMEGAENGNVKSPEKHKTIEEEKEKGGRE